MTPVATDQLTPVERHGQVWLKRDDLYRIDDECGGKVRACLAIAQGATGLVTAGARHSPQLGIVATVARYLGIPCAGFLPSGESEVAERAAGLGMGMNRVTPGHRSVVEARAREAADGLGWRYVPFGMESEAAVEAAAAQVANLPDAAERIVVPVGSGMNLAGILTGLHRLGSQVPVLGVVVGADPSARINRNLAPEVAWTAVRRLELEYSPFPYATPAPQWPLIAADLDPWYEAKAAQYLREGDLLWVVGRRAGRAA